MDLSITLPVLRWVLLGLSAIVLLKSARGWLLFSWGQQRLHTFVSSLVFLYALSALSIQSAYLLEGVTPPSPHSRLVVSLSLNILATCYAIWALYWLRHHPVGTLSSLSRHLAIAVAVAELAEVAPSDAEELAAEARRRVASHLLKGAQD